MAIQSLYPTVRPSLMMDFANTRTLDPRITFTRASTATFFNQNGVLQTAAVNTPRFDHNPVTGESLGLLIEEQRTNLFIYSGFDAGLTGWNGASANIFVGTPGVFGLFGTTTPIRISHNPNGLEALFQLPSLMSGATYTITAFVRMVDGMPPAFNGPATGSGRDFDLVIGNTLPQNAYTVENVGGGLYKVFAAVPAGSGGHSGIYKYQSNNNRAFDVIAVQLESGAFPTSYIPTTTSQVTRAQDFASLSNAGFGDASGALSVLVDAFSFMPSVDFLGSGYVQIGRLTYGKYNFSFGFFSNSPADYFGTLGNFGPDSVFNRRAAFSISSLGYSHVFNGGPVFSSSNTGPFSRVSGGLIHIGRNLESFDNALNGHVRKLKIYPSALPAAQLQALTT